LQFLVDKVAYCFFKKTVFKIKPGFTVLAFFLERLFGNAVGLFLCWQFGGWTP
jgi:hypothetical protein